VAAGVSPTGLSRVVGQARQRITAAAARTRQALFVHAERKRGALALSVKRLRPAAISDRIAARAVRVAEIDGRRLRAFRHTLLLAWQKLESLAALDAFVLSKSILGRGFANPPVGRHIQHGARCRRAAPSSRVAGPVAAVAGRALSVPTAEALTTVPSAIRAPFRCLQRWRTEQIGVVLGSVTNHPRRSHSCFFPKPLPSQSALMS
jgi:hypothetical protein